MLTGYTAVQRKEYMGTIVNLDEISQDGRIVLGGSLHSVKPMSAKMLTVLRSEGDNIEKLLTVVANRVPSLSREALEELSLAQLEAILDVSLSGVKKVEDAAPNGVAPEAAPTSTV